MQLHVKYTGDAYNCSENIQKIILLLQDSLVEALFDNKDHDALDAMLNHKAIPIVVWLWLSFFLGVHLWITAKNFAK